MNTELPKNYDPVVIESAAWKTWMDEKLFHAEPTDPGDPYSIVIPPPNVTGALHLGHAINNTLQDILIRVHRMRGYNAVWIPGIDHAGIATQAVVEKQLKEKENKTRHDVGRDGLVERIWQWKQQFGDRIVSQLQRLGCSCDWDRQRFTLDEQCARAVRETFFKLFKDGLVYRGKRLVNWDTHLQTSISDDEIYHETVKTSLWTINYEIVSGELDDNGPAQAAPSSNPVPPALSEPCGSAAEVVPASITGSTSSATESRGSDNRPRYVTVATTRPETLLGDTAIAVHSQDPRWNWALGKFVKVPLTDRLITIIADDILVDPKFGTGVVKVTPAHDPNDYAVYQRHLNQPDAIDLINLMNPDGTLNENAGERYKGLSMSAARKKVVEDLGDLLVKEEPYETQVGHSDRSKTPIQPYLSDQWFVKMAPLAEPALKVVEDGTIQFFPERHKQQYLSWLGEKRDWPISRQLWWGHRIPVWKRSPSMGHPFTDASVGVGSAPDIFGDEQVRGAPVASHAMVDPDGRSWDFVCVPPGYPQTEAWLEKIGYIQDADVLDTWFSSALWPHSTLGWPEQTPDLAKWYPTRVLLTGRDIITLWVARMVMTGIYNNCRLPIADCRLEGKDLSSLSQSEIVNRQSAIAAAVPFHHVAINPTILDGKGERMSKSKGNGVDPVDIIETHGADALRFTLTQMATETQDVRLPVKKDAHGRNSSDKFDAGRNFCNKLWNASRFVLASIEGAMGGPRGEGRGASEKAGTRAPLSVNPQPSPHAHSLTDRWIISRLAQTLTDANHALATYRFDHYAKVCYDFVWRDFCDWYVEASKPALRDPARAPQTAEVLAAVLDATLRLLHPIIPFITETIWWRLNEIRPTRGLPGLLDCPPSARLIKAAWPTDLKVDESSEHIFTRLQTIIVAVRNLRSEHKADPKLPVSASIAPPSDEAARVTSENRELIETLALCTIKSIQPGLPPPPNTISVIVNGDCALYVEGLVDEAADKQRSIKRIDELTRQIAAMKGRLANAGYIAKAPPKLVEETKQQLADAEAELGKLTKE